MFIYWDWRATAFMEVRGQLSLFSPLLPPWEGGVRCQTQVIRLESNHLFHGVISLAQSTHHLMESVLIYCNCISQHNFHGYRCWEVLSWKPEARQEHIIATTWHCSGYSHQHIWKQSFAHFVCVCVCVVHVSSSSEHTSEMSHEPFSKCLIFFGTDWYQNSCFSLKVALSILVYRDTHLHESQVFVVVRCLSQVLLPQLLLRNRTLSTQFALGVLLLPCWKVSILSSS